MNPHQYRTRFLLDISKIFIVPSILLSICLRLTTIDLGLSRIPSYILFSVFIFAARVQLDTLKKRRDAYQFNARPIPCVVGKWPGNVDIMLKMLKAFKAAYIQEVYLSLFEEYQCTTLNLGVLWSDQIITMDAEHQKFMLSTGFDKFWRGKNQKERMENFLGDGIFNRDDEVWKAHRLTARPFFARERIAHFDLFEKYSARAISILSSFSSSGAPCDLQDLHTRFALDTSSEFLFGKNLDTLSCKLPVAGATDNTGVKGTATHDRWGSFAQAFDKCQEIATRRARLGKIWPAFELFKDQTDEPVKVIKDWLEPLVRDALDERDRLQAMDIEPPVDQKSFLEHLASSTEDVALMRDQVMSVLLASRDTTACLITYTVYFLSVHSDVRQRLRAEILAHCGPSGAPTLESFRKMKYLRAVVNETLRLFPPVPLNVRESRSQPCTLPRSDPTYSESSPDNPADPLPMYMPPNTPIIYLPLLTQRNPTFWGDDAQEFDPTRWLDEQNGDGPNRMADTTAYPLTFAPFSTGPRICLGVNYAYNQVSYFLVRLLQNFDTFDLATDVQPAESLPPDSWRTAEGKSRKKVEKVWPGAALTLFIKGGLWMRIGKSASDNDGL